MKKRSSLPLGHCSRCGSPPYKRSGFSWCKKCNEPIKGDERLEPRDEVIITRGNRINRQYEEFE